MRSVSEESVGIPMPGGPHVTLQMRRQKPQRLIESPRSHSPQRERANTETGHLHDTVLG